MDVSDRRLHVQLTQEAKIASDFSLFRAIFAFAGFVSALSFAFGETAESCGFCASSHPLQFLLAPLRDTSKNCKVGIFSPASKLACAKISAVPPHMRRF